MFPAGDRQAMSVAETVHRPENRGLAAKLWIALALLVAAGIALAWIGAGSIHGLEVVTLHKGSGPTIKPVDGVLLNYEGRLADGTVFDSTEGRGPAPLIAGQAIPGFSQALAQMQEGGRYRVHIPSRLAYGANSPPGSPIPANADLDFDVEVVKVVPNAALMDMNAAGPPPQGQPQQQP
jgi:FKBP-type peptidyl-prolyl cis-trans isomerase FkpA